MNNRICQILNIEKPIIQAPLSWLTDARLVAAVGNAGGMGVLGPNAGLTAETAVFTPEETAQKMREEIQKVKALSDKPFGVNLIPMAENDIWTPPMVEVIKAEKVPAVVYTGYGEGTIKPELFAELKQAGVKIIYRDLNPTPQNTRLAEQAGADIIVATGFDEGGTLPAVALGTFSIVPLIADSTDLPVMGAGGIVDRRTAKAVLALGQKACLQARCFCQAWKAVCTKLSKSDWFSPTVWICNCFAQCQPIIVRCQASWLKNLWQWTKQGQAMKS